MRKFLRHKVKGTIYNYNERMVEQSMAHLEEVTEEEAFPERFAPKHAKGRIKKRTRKDEPVTGRLEATLDVPEISFKRPNTTSPELSQDASKGLPK